ncbi:MAG TPA: hypothetical protein G4O04_01705 [Anaerolineae bacterium]|nr:hypothetical protein [Anaerolineae bacterium]HID83729.1 hypothetical protein [Anaerolineales bacterium]HIQ08646.1 hypothetical protein [Anaerolineaceae bacterium]
MRRWWFVFLGLALVVGGLGVRRSPVRAEGEGPLRVLEESTENRFPDALIFRLRAEDDAVPIVAIRLYYHLLGDPSVTRVEPEFTPGRQVTATYTWDTSQITVPPSAPVEYYWVLQDQAGNRWETPKRVVRYDDQRFAWQERADDRVVVRWYQGDAAFGEFVYQTARQALDRMEQQTGRTLEFPVYVLLYASKEDFASWQTFVDVWVGGLAFPALGVTVEIIPPDSSQEWIRRVIPHEIAHLFFYQAIHANLADWPRWLDEGFAQFYEFGDQRAALAQVAQAARQGRLIPLQALSGDFGRDPEQVRLAYAEALSAVVYIHETWGDQAFQALVEAFRRGRTTRQAFEEALGVSWEAFVAGWLTWMGVPATPAPSPTPTQGYVFPTPYSWNTSPPPSPTPTTPSGPQQRPTPAPTPTETAVPPSGSWPLRCLPSLGFTLLPGALVIGISRVRRRARR